MTKFAAFVYYVRNFEYSTPAKASIYINILDTDGTAGSENATGDSQKKLDVLSNEMFVNSLYNSSVCAILVSEEDEEPIIVEESLSGKNS